MSSLCQNSIFISKVFRSCKKKRGGGGGGGGGVNNYEKYITCTDMRTIHLEKKI